MPTIGHDCHITLNHPNVNGGLPYGFLVDEENNTRPGGVQITREVASDGSTRVFVLFDIVLADNSINPDGTKHAYDRMMDYIKLTQYLQQLSGIELNTPIGIYSNLFAIGFTADERHLPKSSLVKCQLNNLGIYWPPADAHDFYASMWDGPLLWGISFWR